MTPDDLETTAEYEAKVLQTFFEGERLKQIPVHLKKRMVVLRRLVESFERQRVYREPEVNEVLKRHHADFATLRRELVETGLLVRARGEYARPD
jgi:hypothetical protein